jgi:aryl-alcohol dehydrogenase-like predicted oxidoreductase
MKILTHEIPQQWGPLDGGKLARPLSQVRGTTRSENNDPNAVTEADEVIISRVEELAKQKGWTMGQVALSWVNQRVASPIVGFSSVERMDEMIQVKDKTLTADEERHLEEPYTPKPICGHD